MKCIIQSCMMGLDSFVEKSSQYLHTKFRRQNLCFNIVTSKPRLFQWFFSCMYAEPKVNCTLSIWVLFTERRVGGIYPILLSFFWSYSQHFWIKDRNKKGCSFHASYVCVTYRCCFFHSKRQREKKEAHSDLCGCWQLFDLNWGCFYKLVVH